MTLAPDRKTELAFAEFTSLILSETLSAILASLVDQESKAAEMERDALLSPEEFAQRYLTDNDVREEMTRLFPDPAGRDGKSASDAGEPYRVKTDSEDESPAVLALTGYIMGPGDWIEGAKEKVISREGAGHILAAVKMNLALSRQERILAAIAHGIPRVYVDHGRVSAKLTMTMEDSGSVPLAKDSAMKTTGAAAPLISQQRRLLVRPVNVNHPEFLSLKTDVISEVEITFKTVIP
jgi:hypothetical protein